MADGTQALDESGAYVVVLDEDRLPELEQVLRDFKSKTLQEAIYLELHRDVEVRFVSGGFAVSDREQIEQQIREVLATEPGAISLSNKLFSPKGLFKRLARAEDERRPVAQSPLFKEAQRRLTQLQHQEAGEFARAVQQAQAAPRKEATSSNWSAPKTPEWPCFTSAEPCGPAWQRTAIVVASLVTPERPIMTVQSLPTGPGRVDEPRAAQEFSDALSQVAAGGKPVVVPATGRTWRP